MTNKVEFVCKMNFDNAKAEALVKDGHHILALLASGWEDKGEKSDFRLQKGHRYKVTIEEVVDNTLAEPEEELWHCQSCQTEGIEDDFCPTEASTGTRSCPECGSLDVFWKTEEEKSCEHKN